MLSVYRSRKTSTRPHIVLLLLLSLALLVLLSACGDDAAPTQSNNSNNSATNSTSQGTTKISVEAKPDIVVLGDSAAMISFTGGNALSIISDNYKLPYTKDGNKITINLTGTISQNINIMIPSEANLSVTLNNGNIAVDTLKGEVALTLGESGTIRMQNFTPGGTNSITTKNGTIDVTFNTQASCNLTAQTKFGAITSNYPSIQEERTDMQDQAAGTLGDGSGGEVHLSAEAGSITFGPVK